MTKTCKPSFILLIGILMIFGCAAKKKSVRTRQLDNVRNWACVYSREVRVEDIKQFDLAILDSDSHPDLTELKATDTILIGYVSLGEVGEYRRYWQDIANKPWILDRNPNWNSRRIDVRAGEWRQLLTEQIIPEILAQGFDGIFLDTIDNAEYLQRYHPKKKYPGMEDAMVRLIKAIRMKFPSIYIVVNRGFAILNEIAGSIDGVVAESIFTTIDFEKNTTRRRNANEFAPIIKQLKKIRKRNRLKVFTLDYLDLANKLPIEEIVAESRALGFIPYLSTPKLDEVYFYTLKRLPKKSK